MALTIYDIARMANTSVSTVSRYLNDKKIRDDNRKKIEDVLAVNDFVPNEMARAMVSKSLNTVAIITVDIRVPQYAITAYAIEQEFTKRGYNVIICNTSGILDNTISCIKNVCKKQVDGIVFVGSIFNELSNNAEALKLLNNIPIVCANGAIRSNRSLSVLMNEGYGVMMAYSYLRSKGRKAIAYIKDLDTPSAKLKLEGFINSLAKENKTSDGLIFNAARDISAVAEATNEILESNKKIDAIIADDDLIAVGVINALKDKGIRVGEDISVIGYGNDAYSMLTIPKLTCIDNKPLEHGACLADLLDRLIHNKDEKIDDVILNPELIMGESA